MLKIKIPEKELYDSERNRFFTIGGQEITVEHSLVSLSKWESKWNVPFIGKTDMTSNQLIDYVRCMTLTQNVDPLAYYAIDEETLSKISDYIKAPMTATTFTETNKKGSSEVITSELIYYWMVSYNIPVEFQKWHLNRLLTLIRVCSVKNAPPKKMGKHDTMKQNAALNAERRAKYHTAG